MVRPPPMHTISAADAQLFRSAAGVPPAAARRDQS